MSSTNKTTYYELSQYIGTDKPTYLGDYNSDMTKIDTAIHTASGNASTALSTANSAASTASDAATAASAATTTANNAASEAALAKTTAETASTNASAALTAAQGAQTAAAANTITNLAPAYDPTLTYAVGDLVTYVDDQGSGRLYKNIVPIDVPEAFNINKWDDVTVSEIINHNVIAIATGDGVKTISDLLEELRTTLFTGSLTPCTLQVINNDNVTIYNIDSFDNGTSKFIKWSNVDLFSTGTMVNYVIAIRASTVQAVELQTTNANPPVTTSADRSNDVVNSGVVYKVIKNL